jgi:hypothetical protein
MKQYRYIRPLCKCADYAVEFIHTAVVEVDKVGLDHDRRIFEHCGLDNRTSHLKVANIKRGYSKTVFKNVSEKQSRFSDKHKLL